MSVNLVFNYDNTDNLLHLEGLNDQQVVLTCPNNHDFIRGLLYAIDLKNNESGLYGDAADARTKLFLFACEDSVTGYKFGDMSFAEASIENNKRFRYFVVSDNRLWFEYLGTNNVVAFMQGFSSLPRRFENNDYSEAKLRYSDLTQFSDSELAMMAADDDDDSDDSRRKISNQSLHDLVIVKKEIPYKIIAARKKVENNFEDTL